MTTEQEGNWGQFARDIEVKLKGVNMLETLIQDLELNHENCTKETILQAAAELRRLSTAQEPVAWLTDRENMYFDKEDARRDCDGFIQPLYTEIKEKNV
jgi:hypothetical protein